MPVIRSSSSLLASLGLASALIGFAPASWATLGKGVETIQGDTVRLQATRHVEGHMLYQVHQLELSSGTVVREYVTYSGSVFGVVWKGPFKPNLNQLLGDYFPRFVSAGQAKHPDHRMLRVADENIVIESFGRMRAFAGRGYVPSLVPAGVSINEIQ